MKIDASLAAVDQLLKRTIESESIVNDLYRHVFQVSGKKLSYLNFALFHL